MLRDIAISAAVATPIGRALYRRRARRAGYDEGKNSDAYVRGVFARHWEACGRPTAGAVLELGPGGNVGVAQLFAEHGCNPVVCIDTMPYIGHEDLPDVQYLAPEAIEDTTLPSGSFRVIYSHAMLEHVFDPAAAVASIGRLLSPGGVTTHVIDLTDHRNPDEPHAFLSYPNWLWRMTRNRRGWSNRWRASDWGQAFLDAGLDTEVTVKERVPMPAGQKLAREFAHRDRADLEAVGILVVAKKRS